MILTGKAKEDFEKWNNDIYGIVDTAHSNECIEFKHLNPELQNTVIIDWLDSAGIHIELGRFTSGLNFEFWHYTISDTRGIHLNNHMGNTVKEDSRHEATKQAIIKANEIYNETNKKS